jgi:hypothetical protein
MICRCARQGLAGGIEVACGATPPRPLAPNVTLQPQHLGRCAPKCSLPLGQVSTPVGVGKIGVVHVIARTAAFAFARNAQVDPV